MSVGQDRDDDPVPLLHVPPPRASQPFLEGLALRTNQHVVPCGVRAVHCVAVERQANSASNGMPVSKPEIGEGTLTQAPSFAD